MKTTLIYETILMVKSSPTSEDLLLNLLHFHQSLDSHLAFLNLFNGLVSTFPDFLLVALVAQSDWLGRSGKGDDASIPFKIHSPALDRSTGIGQGRSCES